MFIIEVQETNWNTPLFAWKKTHHCGHQPVGHIMQSWFFLRFDMEKSRLVILVAPDDKGHMMNKTPSDFSNRHPLIVAHPPLLGRALVVILFRIDLSFWLITTFDMEIELNGLE